MDVIEELRSAYTHRNVERAIQEIGRLREQVRSLEKERDHHINMMNSLIQ